MSRQSHSWPDLVLLEVLLGGCVWVQWSPVVDFDQCVSRCLSWYTRTGRGRCLKPPEEAWSHLAISSHTGGASKIEEELKAQHSLGLCHFFLKREKKGSSRHYWRKTLHHVHALFCPNTLQLSPVWRLLTTTPSSILTWTDSPTSILALLLWEPLCIFLIHFLCLSPNEDARLLPILKIMLFSHFTAHSKHLQVIQSPLKFSAWSRIISCSCPNIMQLFLLYKMIHFDICMGNDCDTFSNSFSRL